VLGNQDSGSAESFEGNLLEYPQYSRPEEWRGKKVPEVLLSGHHKNIEIWRRQQSLVRTKERRPDLLQRAKMTPEEQKWLEEI
jgi:tRNA-(guanine-N1)-methyltransferase